MDLKKIKALLEKYYNGETSIKDENILREYFKGSNVDPELIADRDIFLYQAEQTEIKENTPDMSEEIWSSITETEDLKEQNNNKISYLYLRIAASIILLLGSYYVLKNQVFSNRQEIVISDTYEDPEIAYEQAKEALLYVSAMLNTGTKHMEPIQKIEEGTQQLNKLSSFNKGIEELKPISIYDKANKYIK